MHHDRSGHTAVKPARRRTTTVELDLELRDGAWPDDIVLRTALSCALERGIQLADIGADIVIGEARVAALDEAARPCLHCGKAPNIRCCEFGRDR